MGECSDSENFTKMSDFESCSSHDSRDSTLFSSCSEDAICDSDDSCKFDYDTFDSETHIDYDTSDSEMHFDGDISDSEMEIDYDTSDSETHFDGDTSDSEMEIDFDDESPGVIDLQPGTQDSTTYLTTKRDSFSEPG